MERLRAPATSTMRFCLITTFYPPWNFGGDGIYVRNLANALARAGHDVHVVHCCDSYLRATGSAPAPDNADHPGITVHRLKSPLGVLSPIATQQTGLPSLKRTAIERILAEGFDVVHYHNVSLVGGPGLLALGSAIKLYTLHDYWLICPTHALFRFNREPCQKPDRCIACCISQRTPPQLWRHGSLMQKAVEHIDAFIAPSMTSQRKHEEFGLQGRIEHIPNFVSMPDPSAGDASGSNGDAGARPYVLFVGRLEQPKGLQTVLPVLRGHPELDLLVAGSGSDEAALREQFADAPNVRFLGQCSAEALVALYRGALALLYPTQNFQSDRHRLDTRGGRGAPLVLIEAFSQGTPVISSDLGQVPLILEQTGGGTAYADAEQLSTILRRLVAEPWWRERLGRAALAAYRDTWTAGAHIGEYLELVEKLQSKRASLGPTTRSSEASAPPGCTASCDCRAAD